MVRCKKLKKKSKNHPLRTRMDFVDYWANYVLTHDDKDWSRQQNVIIDSCLKNSTMTKEEYLKMKGS
jgi:hypothetical protein